MLSSVRFGSADTEAAVTEMTGTTAGVVESERRGVSMGEARVCSEESYHTLFRCVSGVAAGESCILGFLKAENAIGAWAGATAAVGITIDSGMVVEVLELSAAM